MTRQSIGEALSARLFAAETAIDRALAEAAGLAASLPAARADASLSAVTGQKAFDGAAASIAALTEARSHLVRTHHALAALARRLGFDSTAIGVLDKPDDTPPVGGGGGDGPGLVQEFMVSETSPDTVNKSLPASAGIC